MILAFIRESVVLRLYIFLPEHGEARLRIRMIHGLRVFPNLAIWCDKRVLTARDPFKYIVTEVFHEHLLLALHVLNDHVLEGAVGMLLEVVLVFHDTCSAFLISHFD